MSVAAALILQEENGRLWKALDRIRRAIKLSGEAMPDDIADEVERRCSVPRTWCPECGPTTPVDIAGNCVLCERAATGKAVDKLFGSSM